VRIWLGTAPVDLRHSFDGLAERVRQHLHNDPLSGHVFVFRNKRGDRVKLLYPGFPRCLGRFGMAFAPFPWKARRF
jgi:transposase